jgi:hypothetical protein
MAPQTMHDLESLIRDYLLRNADEHAVCDNTPQAGRRHVDGFGEIHFENRLGKFERSP